MNTCKSPLTVLVFGAGFLSAAPVPARAQTPHSASLPAPVCAPPAAVTPPGRIRIDGWFGPRVNDSLVIVVDDTVRWRGVYRLCSEAPASPTVPWVPASADSVRDVSVIRGDRVRALYHLGGRYPSALIIATRRWP